MTSGHQKWHRIYRPCRMGSTAPDVVRVFSVSPDRILQGKCVVELKFLFSFRIQCSPVLWSLSCVAHDQTTCEKLFQQITLFLSK